MRKCADLAACCLLLALAVAGMKARISLLRFLFRRVRRQLECEGFVSNLSM